METTYKLKSWELTQGFITALQNRHPQGDIEIILRDPDKKIENKPFQTVPFPSMEELKQEAARKTAARFADSSGDALQKYCGALQAVFDDEGVTIQRSIRDEWSD